MSKKDNSKKTSMGLFLIILGAFLIAVQGDFVNWENAWPYTLIIPGILFFLGYLINKDNYGVLMPATILTIIGILFIYMISAGWYNMERLWPVFILAPGIGFFAMYFASGLKRSYWLPGSILFAVAFVCFAEVWSYFRYWSVILIIIGIFLVLKGFNKKDEDEEKNITPS